MKHVFIDQRDKRATVMRDAHAPELIYLKTEIHDAEALARNARIRGERLLQQGARNPLIEGDVIGYAFSFPTVQNMEMVKRAEPDLWLQVTTGDEASRFAAARKLAVLYPEYVITHTAK